MSPAASYYLPPAASYCLLHVASCQLLPPISCCLPPVAAPSTEARVFCSQISTFWARVAHLHTREEAKRVYGIIAAGAEVLYMYR